MAHYILKRLILVLPTLFGIMLVNFTIVQFAPGGPIEQMIAKAKGMNLDPTAQISGHTRNFHLSGQTYEGEQGLDPEFIKDLEKQFGFDKPAYQRFFHMLGQYLRLDFGRSYFKDARVIDLIIQKLPVSISLGLWSTLLIYLISIPLGIAKARREGSNFDIWTSSLIIIGHAIPGFLFALLLIVVFAGGSFWTFFPLRGMVSDHWDHLSLLGKIGDYVWHMVLPVTALVIGGFARLTLLTKNSFVDEIHKSYVLTARAKGLTERKILYGHVFRNAMLVVIGGIPAAFASILFTGALLIEIIFSLDGIGLLGFEAAVGRDYTVLFGTLFIFTGINLITHLLGDMTYVLVDPRIHFEGQ